MLQIMRHTWLILFLFILPAQAEIYRWVDENGNVVFSDESHPSAETIDLPDSTTYTPPEEESEPDILKLSPDEDDIAESGDAVPAYQLRIIAPAHDESIWVNNGNVTVSLLVEPQLDAERGDRIRLELDGTPVGDPQSGTSFQLNNISRGSHNVTAYVVDEAGGTLTSSDTITFHLHRASIQNNPPQNPGLNPNPNPNANPANN